ncbi:putative exported protein of unknown function [Bradyrhizobium sp. BTAi1]|nr:putative exported protein of unknown function [Bradyrhizobium sp. BTAi1]
MSIKLVRLTAPDILAGRGVKNLSALTKGSLIVLWLGAFAGSATAQNGVTPQRDAYGNLRRENAPYSQQGINQGPINNGPIRNTPSQPSTTNRTPAQATSR